MLEDHPTSTPNPVMRLGKKLPKIHALEETIISSRILARELLGRITTRIILITKRMSQKLSEESHLARLTGTLEVMTFHKFSMINLR
jgi:hypothetical protein